MIYAVIDTNVFVSAFITHHSDAATYKVVDRLYNGKIKPLFNNEILAEYEDVLSREHFHISKERRETLFAFIRANGIHTERTKFNDLFIDESDRVFYEVSLTNEESLVSTKNLDD